MQKLNHRAAPISGSVTPFRSGEFWPWISALALPHRSPFSGFTLSRSSDNIPSNTPHTVFENKKLTCSGPSMPSMVFIVNHGTLTHHTRKHGFNLYLCVHGRKKVLLSYCVHCHDFRDQQDGGYLVFYMWKMVMEHDLHVVEVFYDFLPSTLS